MGTAIQERRIKASMSVEALAFHSQCAVKTISRVEAGEDVRLSTFRRIATALGADLVLVEAPANSEVA